MKHLFSLIFIVCISTCLAQNNPTFFVENGTCKCPNANFGDSGTVIIDGQSLTFTKRDRTQLEAIINADNNDPEISLTCTSGITNMLSLFLNTDTNVYLNYWDMSNVTNTAQMFMNSQSFNQPLNNWDVSNVTDMFGMFDTAKAFNQNINNWNVSNVTGMVLMFAGTDNFNQPLNNWDTSNVFIMDFMFLDAESFNQNINNWNVSGVTSMLGMFSSAIAFNQPLSNWDVSNVTTMRFMLTNTTSFNGNITTWNTSQVTNMERMFEDAIVFNQDLGNWDVSSLTDAANMFRRAELSINNYDNLLIGWSTQDLNEGINFSGGLSRFCQGEDARNNLINNFNWTITDGGIADNCEALSVNSYEMSDVEVYPNPVSEILNIDFRQQQTNGSYKIYNVTGKLVLNGDISSNIEQISVDKLSNGLYFLDFGHEEVRKFIKE